MNDKAGDGNSRTATRLTAAETKALARQYEPPVACTAACAAAAAEKPALEVPKP